MATEIHLRTRTITNYELVDSGNHAKLERYGSTLISRPDTQAVWQPRAPERWSEASAVFSWIEGKGVWTITKEIAEPWIVRFDELVMSAKLTSFKHTGIFPEQEPNWQWTKNRIKACEKPRVLNLFGYTGGASIRGAQAGAQVTHVDSSKSSTAWAKENVTLSELSPDSIQFIVEDVRSFVKREIRRGAKYEGILLDPPAFGRGAKNEVWKIEEDLLPLLQLLKELLANTPNSFFLLNGYASGYAPLSFLQLVEGIFTPSNTEYGEMRISESGTSRELPAGMYVRFTR